MKSLVVIISFFLLQKGMSQKTEINIGFTGNFSSFRGSGSSNYAFVYAYNTPSNIIISNGPYGKKASVGWGFDFTAQSSSKSGILAGASIGYERLKTSILLFGEYPTPNPIIDSGTKAYTTHEFVNFFPYIGKRFPIRKGLFDINLGIELGLPISASLKIHGTAAPFGPEKPALDVRPRLQAKWQYRNVGVLLAYSIGLFNYYDKRAFSFGNSKYVANSNIGRVGVFYKLN